MTFDGAAAALAGTEISIRDLLELIGEQGLLLFCVFLAVPFLLPVSIPGTSTIFGLLLLLVGGGITANRVPWLPERLLSHRLATSHVANVLRRSANASRRFERLFRPRVLALTHGATLNRLNGLLLVWLALLLMAPLPLFPFTNTVPAIAIVLLAVGMAERDGVVVIIGYVATLAATAYIGVLMYGLFWAGSGVVNQVRDYTGV